MDYIINEKGKWKVEGNIKTLIEPSESYLVERQIEEQTRLEEELFSSLLPSGKELLMAEVELNLINLLLELEVI